MCVKTILLLFILTFTLSFFALAKKPVSVQTARFVEVQITLNENFTLADAKSLPLAPDTEIEFVQDSNRIKVQIPANIIKKLLADSVGVEILRNFILLQPSSQLNSSDGDNVINSSCSGYYQYGEKLVFYSALF